MGGIRQYLSARAAAVKALARVVAALSAVMMATLVGLSTSPAGASSRAALQHRSSGSSTFVVADTSSVEKLDPDVITNTLDFAALGLIYQELVRINSNNGKVVPMLATSWAFSDGNKVLTFKLRKGVTFDDGTTFTSADAVASLKRALTSKTADAAASFLASVKTIVATGTYAIKLELSHRDNSILNGLATVNFAMLPEKAITAGTLTKTPDGTGPYEFSSWSPGNSFVVKRNPNYWGGKATLKSIKIETVPSQQSIASALEANTAQLGLITEPQVVSSLPSSLKTDKMLSPSYRSLMLQDKSGPLENVNNRRAIACAITREQLVEDAVFGDGKPVGPFPVGAYASKPVSKVCSKQNLSSAKKYLKKAGDPSGFSFTAIASDDEDPTDTDQATAIQSALAQVGITMNVQELAGTAYVQDWLTGKFQAALAENAATTSPYTMYGRYFGTGANLGVPAGYSSKTLQKLLLDGDSTASTSKEKKIWTSLSNYLTTKAVWVWLFSAYTYAAMTPSVHGFTLVPTSSSSLESLSTTTMS